MKLILVFCVFLIGTAIEAADEKSGPNVSLPSPSVRKKMLLKMAEEMTRLDGEGLIPRFNRTSSWENTVTQLAQEAEAAEDLMALGRVFRRLDATYPNLHARVHLAPALDERKASGSLVLPLVWAPAVVQQGQTAQSFLISELKKDIVTTNGEKLQKGDRIASINHQYIESWADENFLFCKFPFREQCDLDFYDNFQKEILSWNRSKSLHIEVVRKGKTLSAQIPLEFKKQESSAEPNADSCGVSTQRYPEFRLAYHGYHLCAFESKKDPSVVVLRIRSFQYRQETWFARLSGEIEAFWNNYWKNKARRVSTLIIDVMGNHGGEAPIPYYALLFAKNFQEQYVQFKKISEFERKDVLESMFWGEKGKEIWFDAIKKDGSLDALPVGSFLAPIPQFCASEQKDCRDGLFETRNSGFRGNVKLLINHWCVSSCVGFVYNLIDVLGPRVKTYGLPDSGDSAYGRLTLSMSANRGRVATMVEALQKAKEPSQPEPWVRQVIAATRSTDGKGRVLSGLPQQIHTWVPKTWKQTEEEWTTQVLKTALSEM